MAFSDPEARPLHSPVRAVCGEVEELPLEQMTSAGKKDPMPPSSPHAGNSVRAQYASPIPRSAAHKIVTTKGEASRLLCDDGFRLAAATAEISFKLDTGQIPAGE